MRTDLGVLLRAQHAVAARRRVVRYEELVEVLAILDHLWRSLTAARAQHNVHSIHSAPYTKQPPSTSSYMRDTRCPCKQWCPFPVLHETSRKPPSSPIPRRAALLTQACAECARAGRIRRRPETGGAPGTSRLRCSPGSTCRLLCRTFAEQWPSGEGQGGRRRVETGHRDGLPHLRFSAGHPSRLARNAAQARHIHGSVWGRGCALPARLWDRRESEQHLGGAIIARLDI